MLALFKKLFSKGADFKGLVQQGAIIVDVRTPAEYRTGHIAGAQNIPLDNIKSSVNDLKKKGKPVITVCRSGARSGMAKSILQAAGIEVYNGGPWNLLQRKIS